MSLFIISVQKNFVKQSTSLILNSNKLTSTINIVQNKLIVKSEDIVNKFNQYANEVGLTEKMTLSDLLNSVLGNQ